MISVLIPSRGRPAGMRRVVESARATAIGDVEFVFYLDDDDLPSQQTARILGVRVITGPRILLSETWNRCWDAARFDVAMHCGDDIVFHTPGWDQLVLETFADVADRIALVWGRDGIQDENMATHGFLHRNWVEAVGYFVPSLFSSDYNDAWLFEVAGLINRQFYLPELYTEHLHFTAGKSELDRTYRERLDRHVADDCDEIWRSTEEQRKRDAEKLLAFIADFKSAVPA
jgi:glycosyltransferase involved in cell wall biosynthesis